MHQLLLADILKFTISVKEFLEALCKPFVLDNFVSVFI